RLGRGDWDGLVSVAMAYIGLSIPDLSHLAYLTTYRSAAWFNQCIHRVTRTDNDPMAPVYERQMARIFAPCDPKMCRLAQLIMASQNPGVLALPRPDLRVVCGDGDVGMPPFTPIQASISGRQFNTNGFQCQDHDFIDCAIREMPVLNAIPRKAVEDFK